jgi:chromosome segregation ATPase
LIDVLDIKNVIIIILLLVSIIFGLMWFLGDNDASKEKVKQLESEFKKLEEDKAQSDSKIADWKNKYRDAEKKDNELKAEISRLKADSRIAENKAKKSKEDLDKLQGGISENRKEIERLRKNPPILSDDELLESLIKKMK